MEKENKLKLMRFWLFGTFLIIQTATTLYAGSVVGTGMAIFRDIRYWIAFVVSALLSVLAFFVYSKYLDWKE